MRAGVLWRPDFRVAKPDSAQIRRRMKHIAKKILIGVAVIVAIAAVWLIWFALTPLHLRSTPLQFSIKSGMSLRAVSRMLEDAGVGFEAWQFTVLARVLGESAGLQAGSYSVEQGVSAYGLLRKLTRGEVSQAEITLIEGWNFRQLRAALDASPDLQHATAGLAESQVLAMIGAPELAAEGLFYPDKYLFDRGSRDVDLLRRAYEAMNKVLANEWARRVPGLPYGKPYDALILASLVEKETGLAADRGLIAGVFVNRLRAGMLLQTDPSVIYGMGTRFDGNLRKRDLLTDSPYNTYTRSGLPPTPIAMPGLASLQAALQPAPTEHLYFVARGDGSSEFSQSLDQHNRAVTRYQKKRN